MTVSLLAATSAELEATLAPALPGRQAVGRGIVLPVHGLCHRPGAGALRAKLLVDGEPNPAWLEPWPGRFDRSQRHAFWSWASFGPVERERSIELELELRSRDGSRHLTRLGSIGLVPTARAPLEILPPEDGPRIVVCMTTCDPDPELLERQVRSLRAQTLQSWRCVICDDCSSPTGAALVRRAAASDERFVLAPTPGPRLGVYDNFERVLSRVPRWAEAIALCDHDDEWRPDKLAILWERLQGPRTTLVYSDMWIVAHDGRELAATYWTGRLNNHTDLASLLVANAITGAASLFRAELLEDVLPFPPRIDGAMHDWWIGTIALALGEVGYVSEPLYHYIQHSANVLGHFKGSPWPTANELAIMLRERLPRGREYADTLWRARCNYFEHVRRIVLHAMTLELRCGDRPDAAKQRAIRRMARLDSSVGHLLWMTARGLSRWGRPSTTLTLDLLLARGIAWRLWTDAATRLLQ